MVRVLHPLAGDSQSRITLTGPQFHYLVRVRRLKVGDALEVFDGAGRSFAAKLCAVGADTAQVELGAPRISQPVRRIILVQGLPKAGKMEWILQKGTELGATAFFPAIAKRSVPKPNKLEERTRRWQRIASEAARQCGRGDVPRVEVARPLIEVVQSLIPSTSVLVLNERERHLTLSQAYFAVAAERPIALVVGPEGGLELSEVQSLSSLGATSVHLGSRILRTETSSVAGLAILLHLEGELG